MKRFGFHNLGRHSLATFLMDEPENPAVVQAIMRHAKMDMTLYYSYSSKKAKWHPEIDSQLVPSALINNIDGRRAGVLDR